MSQHLQNTAHPSLGDTAAAGLLNGILAGAAMLAFLAAADLLLGNAQAVQSLGIASPAAPFVELFVHLAVASVYGVLWGAAWRWLRYGCALPGWLLGLAYGSILFVLAQSLVPTLPGAFQQTPVGLLLAAHSVYGLALGGLSR